MSRRLQDKVAVITGGASGIGQSITKALHAEGASVVIGDISGAQEDLAKELGDRTIGYHADVTQRADVEALMAAAEQEFGGLQILVTSAGISGLPYPIAENPDDNLNRVIDINLKGVFYCVRAAVPLMAKSGGGSIVNIASIAGQIGMPEYGPYCASKAGVLGLTRSVAVELASQRIRINSICPGFVLTPMFRQKAGDQLDAAITKASVAPIGRIGLPEEIAPLAVLLASDESAFITGTAMQADGAYSAM